MRERLLNWVKPYEAERGFRRWVRKQRLTGVKFDLSDPEVRKAVKQAWLRRNFCKPDVNRSTGNVNHG